MKSGNTVIISEYFNSILETFKNHICKREQEHDTDEILFAYLIIIKFDGISSVIIADPNHISTSLLRKNVVRPSPENVEKSAAQQCSR